MKHFHSGHAERFFEEIDWEQLRDDYETRPCPAMDERAMIKDIFERAASAKIAFQNGFCSQGLADSIAEDASGYTSFLRTTMKEKVAIAGAAKIAAEHGICRNETAASLAEEAAYLQSLLELVGKCPGGKDVLSALSGLDAAYQILLESGIPMTAKTITNIALGQGIWNPQVATPDMILSTALQKDVKRKGDASRFIKVSIPGHYIARVAK
jgi:hypothetical protein